MLYSALLGNPVEHSVSPILFKIFSEHCGIDYAHIKINVALKSNLNKTIKDLKDLNFCGLNITLPYKIDVIKCVDKMDDNAVKIGAINTISFDKDGRIIGHNTDSTGSFLAIENKLKKIHSEDKILIIGSGGAARAIIFELFQRCKNITILNRDIFEANKVSEQFFSEDGIIKVELLSRENLIKNINSCNIIINATPVGMYPHIKDRIIDGDTYKDIVSMKGKYFFDAIFNPYKTNFLVDAEKMGAVVCSGTYMMIYQAIEAFKIWTGIDIKNIDIEDVNLKLIKSLESY